MAMHAVHHSTAVYCQPDTGLLLLVTTPIACLHEPQLQHLLLHHVVHASNSHSAKVNLERKAVPR